MLLFLVKYLRPDLSNTVRELSKVNSSATNDHVKSLFRVIKFALGKKIKDWSTELKMKMKRIIGH